MHPSLDSWGRAELAARVDEALDVYADAMGVSRTEARHRRGIMLSHLDRPGLQGVAAHEEGRIVGFAYGYLGRTGQWWHDQVAGAMGPTLAATWLQSAFEVCELHVRPAQQGKGLGRALLEALLATTDARTAVLTTPDLETRARGFYRAGGWVDLVRGLCFPGDPRVFAVLGSRLGAGWEQEVSHG